MVLWELLSSLFKPVHPLTLIFKEDEFSGQLVLSKVKFSSIRLYHRNDGT